MTTSFSKMVKNPPKSLTQISEGKNGAYLATYAFGKAVLKVAEPTKRGKTKAHGISVSEIPYREVAYYRLAKLLGFTDVVPETVLTKIKGRLASAQNHVIAAKLSDLEPGLLDEEDRVQWSIKFRETMRAFPKTQCARVAILDFIACTRDRHANNLGAKLHHGKKESWRLVAWDNSASFGVRFARYRSVIHEYVYKHSMDLEPHWYALTSVSQDDLRNVMHDLLSPLAIDHTWLRLKFMIEYPHLVPWKALTIGDTTVPEYSQYFSSPLPQSSSSLYSLRIGSISG